KRPLSRSRHMPVERSIGQIVEDDTCAPRQKRAQDEYKDQPPGRKAFGGQDERPERRQHEEPRAGLTWQTNGPADVRPAQSWHALRAGCRHDRPLAEGLNPVNESTSRLVGCVVWSDSV